MATAYAPLRHLHPVVRQDFDPLEWDAQRPVLTAATERLAWSIEPLAWAEVTGQVHSVRPHRPGWRWDVPVRGPTPGGMLVRCGEVSGRSFEDTGQMRCDKQSEPLHQVRLMQRWVMYLVLVLLLVGTLSAKRLDSVAGRFAA